MKANGNSKRRCRFPPELVRAIATVARDFGLAPDWMNNAVGNQWRTGLPPSLFNELTWRQFEALRVALPGRSALLALKLFAAVDRGPRSVHMQDLLILQPASHELDAAAAWVLTQDAASEFPRLVREAIGYVHAHK